MSENKTSEQPKRPIPAEAATPFYTFAQLWKTEMQRVLDETALAMDKGYAEWQRNIEESSRFSAAQARAMQEAGRALFTGTKVMLG